MVSPEAPLRLSARGVTVRESRGPLPTSGVLDLVVDSLGLTLSGGEPPLAWQIPFSAMADASVARVGHDVLLAATVAGGPLLIDIPAEGVGGGSPAELVELLSSSLGLTSVSEPPVTERKGRRRWLVAVVVLLVVAAGVGVGFGLSSSTSSPGSPSNAARAETASRNLELSDLPSGWGQDDPSTAPLGGLLSTSGSSQAGAKIPPAQLKIISTFQSCVGQTQTTDRVFGAAGVTPVLQISSAPIGRISGSSYLEAGTTTQRYASTAEVSADLAQLRSGTFPTCFAEAIGQMTMNSGSVANATPSLVVTRKSEPNVLGVFTTGAVVTIEIPAGTTTVPAELGVTLLVHGLYEQTLFTFATPGAFPEALRTSLVSLLAARLVGASASASA